MCINHNPPHIIVVRTWIFLICIMHIINCDLTRALIILSIWLTANTDWLFINHSFISLVVLIWNMQILTNSLCENISLFLNFRKCVWFFLISLFLYSQIMSSKTTSNEKMNRNIRENNACFILLLLEVLSALYSFYQ